MCTRIRILLLLLAAFASLWVSWVLSGIRFYFFLIWFYFFLIWFYFFLICMNCWLACTLCCLFFYFYIDFDCFISFHLHINHLLLLFYLYLCLWNTLLYHLLFGFFHLLLICLCTCLLAIVCFYCHLWSNLAFGV